MMTSGEAPNLCFATIARAAVLCLASVFVFSLCSPAQAAVTRSGTLHAIVTDNFRTGESTTRYILKSGEQATVVRPTELAAEPGDRVAITGAINDGRLVGVVETTTENAQEVSAGPRKVAVLLMKFPGDPAEPWSPEETRSKVFTGADSANVFYEEESYDEISLIGKLNSDGDVFGWFSLDTPTAGCPYWTWRGLANQAATDEGIDLSDYDHIVYISTHQSSCGWNGVAAVNGSWFHINGNLGAKTLTHELGHNLGLLHAGSWRCTSDGVRVQISDSCTTNEYGDPFDTQGNIATRHHNGWNLDKLAILSPENVETVTASGTYTIQSALNPTLNPTVLRIPRTRSAGGNVTSWYYLEVRQTGGVFENVTDASITGVSIRKTGGWSNTDTLLIDCSPATTTFNDAPCAVGQSFIDGTALKITTLSAGGGSATVSVEYPPAPDIESPTAPTNLTASPTASSVQLSWSASTDNVGVDHYDVFRDGSQIGTAPGTSFLDTAAAVGDHSYVLYAVDAAGNQSAASSPALATVPDTTPPSAPTDLTASATASGVQLGWSASTDNVGVDHYDVFRDGTQIATTPGTSFLDTAAAVALVDRQGSVSAWTDTGSGYTQQLSVTDSTFNSGIPGFEGGGNFTLLKDFKAGELQAPATADQIANLPVTEAFDGSSASLTSFNNDFSKLGWVVSKGQDTTSGWGPITAFSSGSDGISHNTSLTDNGEGVAAAVTLSKEPALPERFFSLWLDMSSPAPAKNGYELRFTWRSTNTYDITLSKWQSGSKTVLDSSTVFLDSSTVFLDSTASVGDHSYVLYAVDAAGNQSAASSPALATVPDTTPPSAPTDLTASATASGVQLGWSASTDNVGVDHYDVFRDGTQIATTPGTSFLDTAAAVGDHSYVVYAQDAAGNRSAASEPLAVTVAQFLAPTCVATICTVTFTPPTDPEKPPTRVNLSLGIERTSLRQLRRSGRVVVAARVNKAARVTLVGWAKLGVRARSSARTRFVRVLKRKTIRFGQTGRKRVVLTLTRRGRRALRHLSRVRIVIVGRVTDFEAIAHVTFTP